MRADHLRPDTTGAGWLWRAFQELATCRTFGMGVVGPIPLTAIWAYIDRYSLPEWTIDAIFSLDAAWRAGERQRAPAPAPPPEARGAPARRRPPVRRAAHG